MEGGEENAGIWCPPALWKRSALAACRSGLHGVPPSCNGRGARDAIVTRCDTIVTYSFSFSLVGRLSPTTMDECRISLCVISTMEVHAGCAEMGCAVDGAALFYAVMCWARCELYAVMSRESTSGARAPPGECGVRARLVVECPSGSAPAERSRARITRLRASAQ